MSDEDSEGWNKRRALKRAASVLGVVLLVLIVVPFVIYLFPQLVGADQSYVVLSGSMEPTISPGDVIVVGSVAPAEVQAGDVITFRRTGESRPTTHRVVEVVQRDGGPAFRTQGDANEDPDQELVSASQVVGEVPRIGGYLLVIPLIGRVILFAGTQTGFFALVMLPVVLFVLNEIWNVIDATRESGDDDAIAEEAASSADESDSGAAITFTAAELTFGLAVLAAFFAYALWVAYATFEVWAIGVAGAVGAGLLLVAGLYLFGGATEDAEAMDDLPEEERDRPSTLSEPPVDLQWASLEEANDHPETTGSETDD